MWGQFIAWAEDFIIGQIEANAAHPDRLGWIQQLLAIIVSAGSAKLEAYAEPRLALWIESAPPGMQQALMQLAIQAIEKRGGEIGKIVTAADAIAVAEMQAKVDANAAAIESLKEGHAANMAAIADMASMQLTAQSSEPTPVTDDVPPDPTPAPDTEPEPPTEAPTEAEPETPPTTE